jgi:catechol 2,3-dioxygenase-like lactoylglutathione lyase family enzyme
MRVRHIFANLVFAGIALLVATAVRAEPADPIKGIRYIGLTVSDIDATLGFYNKAVPYKLIKRYMIKGSAYDKSLLSKRHARVEVALVQMPNVFIQLTDFDPGRGAATVKRAVIGPGYTHICFQSPASDSAYPKFRKAGLAMVSRGDSPVDIGGYGITYAYGRDPDGTMIETEILSSPRRNEAAWIGHVGNVTHDVDAMLSFYTKVLGYGPRRRLAQTSNPKFDAIGDIDGVSLKAGWFGTRNVDLEFWQYVTPKTTARAAPQRLDELGYNSVAFEVADIDAESARLVRLGVRLAGPVLRIDGWKIQHAYDADGNLFSVQQNIGGNKAESIDAMLWVDPKTYR